MPMDGFTLSFIARELRELLIGGRVDKISQPEHDLLLLSIRNQGANHKLLLSVNVNNARAQITAQSFENPPEPPVLCMLIRKHLTGSRVTAIDQLGCDRVLIITFQCVTEMGDETRKRLVLELMGRHSNLSMVDEDNVTVDSVYHVNADISRVRVVMPGKPFHMPPEQDKLDPFTMTENDLSSRLTALSSPLYKSLIDSISGLSAVSAREICAQIGVNEAALCEQMNVPELSHKIVALYGRLPDMRPPVALFDSEGRTIEYFPFRYLTYSQDAQKAYPSLSEAMDAFYGERELSAHIRQHGAGIRKRVKTNIARLEKKKAKMLETLTQNELAEQNRIYGELLTANLHNVPKGASSVKIVNYYDEAQASVEIPLMPEYSPARNAQQYYKKYRKAKGARLYAQKELTTMDRELELLENVMDDLDKCTSTADLNEIRYFLMDNKFLRPDPGTGKRRKVKEGTPYRFRAADGAEIVVGKNAVQNDRITLHARAHETWLHAQGVAGSHVIIKTEEEPSDETLLFAAKLAAYFSKGRNHPSFPIDYTKRKHVKKKSGTPAGFVIYQHFKTIYIGLTPRDLTDIKRLVIESAGGVG